MTSPGANRYEVAVVGGGPAGAVAARTLASRGRSVILLEASRYDGWRLGETLPPSISEPLSALGLSGAFDALDAVSSHGIRSCWGDDEPESRSFIANPRGGGWHVDRAAFDRMLSRTARRAGATVRCGRRVTGCSFEADGSCSLSVERADRSDGGQEHEQATPVRAGGLIDATGRNSALTRRLGGRRDVQDRLTAAAMQFRVDADRVGRYTLIEAAEDGWWYSAPVPGGRMVAMWMTDSDLLGECRRRDPWMVAATASGPTAERIEEADPVRGPEVAAATSYRLDRDLRSVRWLAVGDAAMGVDPLSGSGVQRALDTGVRGALTMERWLDGEHTAAETYERELDDEFEAYLQRHRAYYGSEDRWPDSRFWQRRADAEGGDR